MSRVIVKPTKCSVPWNNEPTRGQIQQKISVNNTTKYEVYYEILMNNIYQSSGVIQKQTQVEIIITRGRLTDQQLDELRKAINSYELRTIYTIIITEKIGDIWKGKSQKITLQVQNVPKLTQQSNNNNIYRSFGTGGTGGTGGTEGTVGPNQFLPHVSQREIQRLAKILNQFTELQDAYRNQVIEYNGRFSGQQVIQILLLLIIAGFLLG